MHEFNLLPDYYYNVPGNTSTETLNMQYVPKWTSSELLPWLHACMHGDPPFVSTGTAS